MTEPGSSSTVRQRPYRTLNREGSAFLANYARTIGIYPSRTEKLHLLQAIHAIPGNESFTLGKLSNWFVRHRASASTDTAHTRVLLDDETILFPKLTPTHLQQLRVLHKKLHEPNDGVMTFWAKRIGADRDEVAAWIEYQQEKAKESATPESPDVSPTMSSFPRPHLPTPAKSLSPQARMPSLPPIMIKVEESRQCLSPVSSLDTSATGTGPATPYTTDPHFVLEGLPPLSRSQHVPAEPADSPLSPDLRIGCQPPWRDPKVTLEASIRESLRPATTPWDPPPKTADEFAAKFEPVENMIDTFMKKYQSGQLVQLGWDSSLGKPLP